ncbi:MAG: acylphosphatase [Bacteroidales bacterium]|nr:acylphosphatase [Bacteroidales bacterium]
MKQHLNLLVSGKVHNVGYRFTCLEMAIKMNITGFVRNKRSGDVYIEAEGEEEDINKFVEWCRKGPVWAKVYDLRISEGEVQNFKSFDIVR